MLQDIDLSKINTPFDIIKFKNEYLGNSSRNYLKEVFETNTFKIKELYRLYVAYDRELNKSLNYKIDQELLNKTLEVKTIYDISSIILEDYDLDVHEWNFLFEELNTNLNLNNLKDSQSKLLKKIKKESFKNHEDEVYIEIFNKYAISILNYCKNEMHINTFMTRKIKTKFLDLNSLSTPTIELLEEVVNKETLNKIDEMDNLIHHSKGSIYDFEEDLVIEPFDDSFLEDDEEVFTSVYLDFSKTKSLDELLKEMD